MTTPERSIEEIVEEFAEVCDSVEFLHGVPVKLPAETKAYLRARIRVVLKAERQRCEEVVGQIRLLIAKYAKEDDMDVSGLVNEINALCK